MEIAILGYRRNLREDVARQIIACLEKTADITLRQYGLDEPIYNPMPPETGAAFVIVDDAKALHSLRTVARWGNLPLIIVSNHPQYAMEGIRLQVRHYLLFPLTEPDVSEALKRIGVEVKHREKDADI